MNDLNNSDVIRAIRREIKNERVMFLEVLNDFILLGDTNLSDSDREFIRTKLLMKIEHFKYV